MEYIIDGYNLIKGSYLKKTEKYSTEYTKNTLFEILFRYKKKHPCVKFTIVFDGKDTLSKSFKEIKVIFSGEITADNMIRNILKKKKTNDKTIVVSDDKEVQISAKILGSKISSVKEFLNTISPKQVKKKHLNIEKTLNYKEILKIEQELKEFYETRKEKT